MIANQFLGEFRLRPQHHRDRSAIVFAEDLGGLKTSAGVSAPRRQDSHLHKDRAPEVAKACQHPTKLNNACTNQGCKWRMSKRCNAILVDNRRADENQVGVQVYQAGHLEWIANYLSWHNSLSGPNLGD
ncbi:MAG: hypothetical protein ABSF53_23635 [Terracidiphilus sp.]